MTNKSKTQEKPQEKSLENTSQNDNKKIEIPAFIAIESTLGAISILSMKSQSHKYVFAGDYEWLFLPSIALKQFALFRSNKNEPVAFVSWASVSEEVEKRLAVGITKLQPKDWNSGDRLYIIDIISPFASQQEVLTQLNNNQLKDKEVKILSPKKDGKGLEIRILNDVVLELAQNKSNKESTK
jgi:cytolysin-activating lysine-acyltransferase